MMQHSLDAVTKKIKFYWHTWEWHKATQLLKLDRTGVRDSCSEATSKAKISRNAIKNVSLKIFFRWENFAEKISPGKKIRMKNFLSDSPKIENWISLCSYFFLGDQKASKRLPVERKRLGQKKKTFGYFEPFSFRRSGWETFRQK